MLTIENIPAGLRPGATCLYQSGSIEDRVIEWKEGDPDTAHVEVYVGAGTSVASRNGIGVNSYPFRPEGLVHVRQPVMAFDLASAMDFFKQVQGARYGWGDIGSTLDLLENPEDAWTRPDLLLQTGMDCSHFASLFLLAGRCPQFDPKFDARKITPRDFKIVRESISVWDFAVEKSQSGLTSAATPDLSPRAEGEQIQKV